MPCTPERAVCKHRIDEAQINTGQRAGRQGIGQAGGQAIASWVNASTCTKMQAPTAWDKRAAAITTPSTAGDTQRTPAGVVYAPDIYTAHILRVYMREHYITNPHILFIIIYYYSYYAIPEHAVHMQWRAGGAGRAGGGGNNTKHFHIGKVTATPGQSRGDQTRCEHIPGPGIRLRQLCALSRQHGKTQHKRTRTNHHYNSMINSQSRCIKFPHAHTTQHVKGAGGGRRGENKQEGRQAAAGRRRQV